MVWEREAFFSDSETIEDVGVLRQGLVDELFATNA